MELERIYYAVSEEAAHNAKRMNSFNDYKAGSATAGYREMVDEAYHLAEGLIKSGRLTPDNAETVWWLATKYARKMAAWFNKENANAASCPSVLISGAGNFPVRKKEKQVARTGKLMDEYEYIQGLLARIRNIAYNNAIKSSDPNAVELLEAKAERLQAEQDEMKAANAYYRKNKSMKGYVDKDGVAFTDEEAAKTDEAIKKDYSWNQQPYAGYLLSNNNANIRRVRERIELIKRNKAVAAAGGAKYETGGLCEVIEDEAAMRIRLIFPDKPDTETRNVLKRNGFVWSPSVGAWQRQLNNNGRYAAKRALEALREARNG
jgi:hypothetical protein